VARHTALGCALHRNTALQGGAVAQAWSSASRIPCFTIPPDSSKSGNYFAHVPKPPPYLKDKNSL